MRPTVHFDIATLFVTEALVCLIFSLVLYVLAKRFPDVPGPMRLAQGFFVAIISILFFLFRGYMPLTVSVLLGNGLVWAAYLLFYIGTATLIGFRPRLRVPILLAIVSLAPMAYFTAIHDLISVRTIIVSITGVLLQINMFVDLVRNSRRGVVVQSLTVFVGLAMSGDAVRAVVTALHGVPANIFQDDFAQSVHLLMGLIAACGLGVFSMALIAREITASIERNARRDALTGALNRLGIEELLAIEMERARRTFVPLSVALLDIDHFKAFNDTGGHATGDEVLRNIVGAISHQLRTFDACGRIGGDEFLVVLPGSTAPDIAAVCNRILREVASLPPHAASGIAPTVSIGFTQADVYDTVVDLLARADRALYAAKHQGRNCAQMELAPLRTEPLEVPGAPKSGRRSRMRRAAPSIRDFHP